ncbi:MAG: hypothetical protein KAH32_06765 [Chlamydiia bacterium]|nr:hypothetical protein [Chlamydiia bacterium]
MIFKLSDLDGYAIIDEPCTVIVKCNSTLEPEKYISGEHARWLVNIKAISKYNLDLLKEGIKDMTLSYTDVGHLLMVGAIWHTQIVKVSELPVKGERLIATFDYVDDILRCTNITLIPRTEPELFLSGEEALGMYEKFNNILHGK